MITGNEPINGWGSKLDEVGMSYGDGNDGETLYQRALRDFMCAIVTMGTKNEPSGIARDAHSLTVAYISQLNKQQP